MSVFKYSNSLTVSKSVKAGYSSLEYWFSSHDGSTPLTETELNAVWETSPEGWTYGKYIWTRSVRKNADNTVIDRSTPAYDGTLTTQYDALRRWEFSIDKDTYYYNARQPSTMVITVATDIQYYGEVVPNWYIDDTLVTLVDNKITIPAFTDATHVIWMKHPVYPNTISKGIPVVVLDVTEYGHNYDLVTAVPSDAIDGDFFVAKTNFSEGSKTYSEGIPYVKNSDKWIELTSVDSEFAIKMSSALSSVLNGGNVKVPSTSALYGMFDNLASNTVVTEKLFANDIQSKTYEEGVTGYKLTHSDGKISAVKAHFVDAEIDGKSTIGGDAEVLGTIKNIDSNGNEIFLTNKDVSTPITIAGSAADGVTIPSAFNWSEFGPYLRNWIEKINENKTYECTGVIQGKSLKHVRKTNSQESQYEELKVTSDYWTSTETIFKNNYYKPIKISSIQITRNYSQNWLGFQSTTGAYRLYVVDSNSNEITIGEDRRHNNTVTDEHVTFESVTVPARGYLKVYFGECTRLEGGNNVTGNAWARYYAKENWSVGTYLVFSDGTEISSSNIPSTGFDDSAISIGVTGYGTLSLTKTAQANWPVKKYYNLHYSSTPSNTSERNASFFSSYTFSLGGVSYNVISVTYSKTSIRIITQNGTTFSISKNEYVPAYSFSFNIVGSVQGAYAKNVLPLSGSSSNIGGSGNDGNGKSLRWGTLFCDTINYFNIGNNSKREYKENIIPFDRNALEIVNDTSIVSFNYKDDIKKTKKIGFIADVTDEAMSGKNHDVMDVNNCIGVLLKAIQELSKKIDDLEKRINI